LVGNMTSRAIETERLVLPAFDRADAAEVFAYNFVRRRLKKGSIGVIRELS
jgi:hypothetical protein